MALKKSELYSSLWPSCDEFRGGIRSDQTWLMIVRESSRACHILTAPS